MLGAIIGIAFAAFGVEVLDPGPIGLALTLALAGAFLTAAYAVAVGGITAFVIFPFRIVGQAGRDGPPIAHDRHSDRRRPGARRRPVLAGAVRLREQAGAAATPLDGVHETVDHPIGRAIRHAEYALGDGPSEPRA